jgi:hypothetical protein
LPPYLCLILLLHFHHPALLCYNTTRPFSLSLWLEEEEEEEEAEEEEEETPLFIARICIGRL